MNDDTIDADDGKLAYDKDGILAELRKRVQWAVDFDADTRSEALEDLRFVAGQQWPDAWRRTRELEARPCLTINKLPAFIHQITNDQRQNKPSIKIHPVDDNADVETAQIIQGLIRHIEYSSNADFCYDSATANAVQIGFGYFRLVTEYCDETSFDQDIKFKRIRNPFTVYCGPHLEPDGSDMLWCVISEEVPRDEFKREYPKANASDSANWPTGPGDANVQWLSVDSVRVAEYYRIELKPATLCLMADGTTGYKDEMPTYDPAFCVKERATHKRVVMWRKCTGYDVLEEREIPGRFIPVFPVYGDEIDLDGKVIRSGVVRFAKDPQRMYNYWMTSATEEVALRPKTPFIGAEGQFEDYEDQWSQANNRSFAYLTYKPTTVDGILVPPPQRSQPADIPSGTLALAMHANDNIKATTGIFDASLGARGNETSGRAILARQREGDVANYHYVDNLSRAIRHAGRVIVAWIPKIYDTQRVVRIMGEDESLRFETVNKVEMKHELDEFTQQIQTIENVLNDVRVGTYDVTVTTGPAYSTMRQEAAQAMVEFGQSWPKLMDIAGDKVVKAMDWPGAEEIAERIKKTIPPELTREKDEGEEEDLPPQVVQQIEQATQYIEVLQRENQMLKAEATQKAEDRRLEKYKIDVDATTKVVVEEMKAQMQPLQDLGGRIQQIEAALGQLADALVPAPVMGTGFEQGPMQ
jgi:hypothetical protein